MFCVAFLLDRILQQQLHFMIKFIRFDTVTWQFGTRLWQKRGNRLFCYIMTPLHWNILPYSQRALNYISLYFVYLVRLWLFILFELHQIFLRSFQFHSESRKIEHWLAIRVNLLTSMFDGFQITDESVLKELVHKLKVFFGSAKCAFRPTLMAISA